MDTVLVGGEKKTYEVIQMSRTVVTIVVDGVEVDLCHLTRGLSEEQMAFILETYVDTYDFERIAIRIGKQLGNIPNSLQRNVVILCLGILRGLSSEDVSIDTRNRVAIAVAREVTRLHNAGKLHDEPMI